MSKILFIGDVVGKPGRKILKEVLPQWKEKYKPDVTIVNVENLAHGKGVTLNTLADIDSLDIDCYTGGNHIFNRDSAECFEKYDKLIRPDNYPNSFPGHSYYRFAKDGQQYLVISLSGQVFMEKQFEGEITNPFLALDKLLLEQGQKGDIIVVDFHAEATSEKVAFGYYGDGRITAMFGTHTHVPTADARVLPGGTGHITDVGMTGALNGVIGVVKENVLEKFLHPEVKFKYELEENGPLQINGVLVETSENGKAKKVTKLYAEI
jgi:metallophosphoesterase (TIGR00282 family)